MLCQFWSTTACYFFDRVWGTCSGMNTLSEKLCSFPTKAHAVRAHSRACQGTSNNWAFVRAFWQCFPGQSYFAMAFPDSEQVLWAIWWISMKKRKVDWESWGTSEICCGILFKKGSIVIFLNETGISSFQKSHGMGGLCCCLKHWLICWCFRASCFKGSHNDDSNHLDSTKPDKVLDMLSWQISKVYTPKQKRFPRSQTQNHVRPQ